MLIVTNSGRKYFYSPITNKIGIWENNYSFSDVCPVSYKETTDYSFDKISMFTIEITQQCNLRCKYCIYSGDYPNRRTHNDQAFFSEDIPNLINFIITHADKSAPTITICFYGGEALLQKGNIEKIISGLDSIDLHFDFSISTNGILLNEDTIKWICDIPNLKVTVTIDGNKFMHDANRQFPSGKGSFDFVMNKLRDFQEHYPDEYNKRIQFLATVDSISRLPELSDFWQNNPIIASHRPVHISSIIPNFSKNRKQDIDLRDKQLSVYTAALNSYLNGQENILTDELKRLIGVIEHREYFDLPIQQNFYTCCHNPYSCFISSNGKIFVCEKFNTDLSVGDIFQGFNREAIYKINTIFFQRKNTHCSKCWAKRLCRICATNVNYTTSEFEFFCTREKQRLQLALKFFIEVQEHKHLKS